MKKLAAKILTPQAARNASALSMLAASLALAGAPWDTSA